MQTTNSSIVAPDDEDVAKMIHGLKNNKSCDPYGLQAEHFKNAHPSIICIVKHILNKILKIGKIPELLKERITTPVVKKSKPKMCPDSYRRITVNSVLGKQLEKTLVPMI